MKKKKIKYRGRDVTLSAEEYRSNKTLALMLHYDDGETEVVTVNLQDPIQSDSLAYLDTNNQPGIEDFIQKNGLGLPMGGVRLLGPADIHYTQSLHLSYEH